MVWNVGGGAPQVQHFEAATARREAERLAKQNPGQQFAVLQAVAVCETQKPVNWVDFNDPHVPGCVCDACIPF